jgi:hypothetical protein
MTGMAGVFPESASPRRIFSSVRRPIFTEMGDYPGVKWLPILS